MSRVIILAAAIAVVAPIGAAGAMPTFSNAIASNVSGPPGVTKAQYYYKGHKYKRRTKQHFIRKYSGNDR